MAIIGKIRERSGLLVGIVGGALVLFILDALLNNRGGGGRREDVLGEVGGEEIRVADFERRVDDEVESYRNDFNQPVTAQLTEQVRNSVWSEMVKSMAMMGQVQEAGFTLTKDEYDDIRFGENILPEFRSQFQGPDGQPDKKQLQDYFSRVQLNAPVYHEIQSRRIQENRLYAKYTTLVKKSVFVNSAQARDEFAAKNTRATFNFVARRYDSEVDSLYAVSDQDLRRYYDQHKNDPKYKQKASRAFDYVLFPVVASESDRATFQADLAKLKTDFETATNDSSFVVANADSRTYSKVAYTEGTADKLNDSLITHAAVGAVVGPYAEGELWKLVKVKELVDIPEVRVRHILFSIKDAQGADLSEADQQVKKARADSVLAVLRKDKKKFDDLNAKFTEDPGGKSNGGDYGFFDKDKQFVQEYKDAGFNNPTGWMGVVKTQFGYHVMEVLEKRTRSERRVITVDRTSKPSPATFKEVYKKANEFSLRNTTVEAMKKAAEEQGLQVTSVDDFRADARYVQGLQQPNSTITWVNRAEVGKVSEPQDAGDNYVVAIVKSVKAEGMPELEDVREAFTKEVVKEKKAEAYMAKMTGKTDLTALATELGTSVQNAPEMLYNAFSLPGGFGEFEVIGEIFALANGQTSVPLKGETAVYVVSMVTRTDADPKADVSAEKSSLQGRMQSRAENSVFNALRDAAGVVDNRYMYY